MTFRDRFLVIPFGLHWSEVKPEDLIEVDVKTGETLTPVSFFPDQTLKQHHEIAEVPTHNYYNDGKLPRHSMEPSATAFHLHSNIHLRKGAKYDHYSLI